MERDPMEMALSTDIVLDIVLSHLKVRDLLSCRLASKFWNKIASSVLRKRWTMMKKISEEAELMELEECMEKSSDFPFAGLKLDRPWRLNSGDSMEFFRSYGARFRHVHLDISWTARLQCLAPFMKHLPRLSILELGLLFRSSRDLEFPVTQGDDDKILDLSSVQVIKISSPSHVVDEKVIRELIAAASPSLRIECEDAAPDLVGVLKKVGRLQAVTSMKFGERTICGSEYIYELHQLNMDEHLSTESISLTKLDFTAGKCLSMNGLLNILISSQHTLKVLHLGGQCPSEYSWDHLPVLAKLTSFSSRTGNDFWTGSFFRGRHGHKFPALKELKLCITDRGVVNGFTDGFFVVPSVTMVDLEGNFGKLGMKELAQAFPNVIQMRLDYEYYSGNGVSGSRNPFHIWSVREFKHLERLKMWNFEVKRPSRSYVHMDSFLTGMSAEICENLLIEKKLKLKNSPLNRILRVNPSLLQLPQLKELVVCVKAGRGFKQLPEDGSPFISMLSVWYALDMMPNLGVKFVYDQPSAPSRKDKRDKALLDAAFKHVKDLVKLEPYLY